MFDIRCFFGFHEFGEWRKKRVAFHLDEFVRWRYCSRCQHREQALAYEEPEDRNAWCREDEPTAA